MKRLNDLLSFVKEQRVKNKPLSSIFKMYADKTGLNKYSVRNLYYYGLNKLENGGENKSEFERKSLVRFSKKECEDIMSKILENKLKGISVRKTCMLLAGNDKQKCIRYINKYRLEMRKEGKNKKDNIVRFVPKNTLTDNDIASLFSGLVKLVKDNAIRQAGVEKEQVEGIKQGLIAANEEILSLRHKLRKAKDRNEILLDKLNNSEEKMKSILRVD